MKVIAVIPARYGSTRFPGKVLANDTGKFLVQHTYEQVLCAGLVEKIFITTDDTKVYDACAQFNAPCVMTSSDHQSGTDRIAEAVKDIDTEIIVNVQADEPEIEPEYIDRLAKILLDNPGADMATLVVPIENEQQMLDPNVVKAVLGTDGRAIYFSRSPIPFNRDKNKADLKNGYRHLGIYAYRKDFVLKITTLPRTPLEIIESLEQLRAIENGFTIMASVVPVSCEGIDTPQQYEAFVNRIKS